MRNIRAVINSAIDEEIICQNNYPFRKFKIKNERTIKRSLTLQQLKMLRDYKCEPYQELYKDVFMLIFYLAGINMIDLLHLKEINNGRIEFKRAKTGRLYSIKVEPEALAIINKYRGQNFLLNIMDRYKHHKNFLKRMNSSLRKIGKFERVGRGGKKIFTSVLFPCISSYWARHTVATLMAELDVPKETIAAALGHGGNSVTDIYINFDNKKVDAAMRKVIDYVNG